MYNLFNYEFNYARNKFLIHIHNCFRLIYLILSQMTDKSLHQMIMILTRMYLGQQLYRKLHHARDIRLRND